MRYEHLDMFIYYPIISGIANYSDLINSTIEEWMELHEAAMAKSDIENIFTSDIKAKSSKQNI